MDGEETFSDQTMPRTARPVRKKAEPSQPMQPRRFDYQSTEGGARAQGAGKTAESKRLPTREVGAWGHAPRTAGGPLTKELPPPREKRARGVGQEELAEGIGTRRCPRPHLDCRTLRPGGERGRGLGRYHLRRKGHPLTRHRHLGGAAGAGAGQVGEAEVSAGQSGCNRRADRFFPIQEGCQARCN
jgi:hypothetical protein